MSTLVETAVSILLTLLLALVGCVLLQLALMDPHLGTEAVLDGARLLGTGAGVAIVVWMVAVAIGAVRNRARSQARKVGYELVAAVLAGVVNLVFALIIGFTGGGWSMFFVVFAIMAGVAFLIGAGIAVPLTHLVFFRTPVPTARP